MERIKLEILKAREGAQQHRQEASDASLGLSASPSDRARAGSPGRGAVRSGGHGGPGRRFWRLAGSLFLGLAAVLAIWTLRPDTVAMPTLATVSTEAAPAPRAAVVTPVRPAEPAKSAEVRSAIAASVGASAAVAEATKNAAPVASQDVQVVAAVEAWRQAWSKRDMTTYLGSYSEAFTPPDGMSREDWIASRYRNVGGRKSIDVQIQRLLVLTPEEGRARVSFLQDYTSGGLRELKRPKTLDLVRGADDSWRIVGEWQGNPPPAVGPGKS